MSQFIIVIQSAQKVKYCRDATALTDTRRKERKKALTTISVVDLSTKQEHDCFSFECLCIRDPDFGNVGYFVYGCFMSNSYFELDRCLVFYSTDVNAAMDKLEDLKARLAKVKQMEVVVAARLTDLIMADSEEVIS